MSIGDLNFVTVHGTYKDMSGATMTGSLTFTPSVAVLDPGSDLIILPKAFTATLTAGAFSISLPATDDPDVTPLGWSYTVVENVGPASRSNLTCTVPITYVSTGVSLATLLGTSFVGAPSGNYVTLTEGDGRYGQLAGATWLGTQDFTGATVLGVAGPFDLTPKGAWATATAYIPIQTVIAEGSVWECIVSHTSGTFDTDKTNGMWRESGVDIGSIVTLPADAAGVLTDDGSGHLSWGAGGGGGGLFISVDGGNATSTYATSVDGGAAS